MFDATNSCFQTISSPLLVQLTQNSTMSPTSSKHYQLWVELISVGKMLPSRVTCLSTLRVQQVIQPNFGVGKITLNVGPLNK